MQPDIRGALRELGVVADRIAELLEWEQLAQHERRPDRPPAFQLRDHLPEEIVGLYSAFLTLSSSAHRALAVITAPGDLEQAALWRRELLQLEHRVMGWRINERFIRP
jgi:hypothetical protein